MDDTDILSMAGTLGYTCELTDPDGYDLDGYELEKTLVISGIRIKIKMEIDLFAKICGWVKISYNFLYKKDKGAAMIDALGECMKIVERDLAAFEAEGYRIKA